MEQNSLRDATSVDLFKSWLVGWLAQELLIDREKIDTHQSFLSYGLDSVQAMTMVGDLEANLEVRLPPTLAWDYPDIDALSAHLFDRMTTMSARSPEARQPKISTAVPEGPIQGLAAKLDTLSDRDVDEVVHPFADTAR
jgi:acyl carrier protein